MWAQVWQIFWTQRIQQDISSQNLFRKARKEGLIQNDWFAHVLIKEVNWSLRFKEYCKYTSWDIVFKKYPYQVDSMANMNGMLICYGWINIPLVYTQVSHKPIMDYWFVDQLFKVIWNQLGLFFLISLNQSLFSLSGSHIGCVRLFCCLSLWSTIPLTNPVQSGRERLRPGKISSEEGNNLFQYKPFLGGEIPNCCKLDRHLDSRRKQYHWIWQRCESNIDGDECIY